MKSKSIIKKMLTKFRIEYTVKNMQQYITNIIFQPITANPLIHDYLVYTALMGNNYSYLPQHIKKIYEEINNYLKCDAFTHLITQHLQPVPKITGHPLDAKIYSNDLILELDENLTSDKVLKKINNLYLNDFILETDKQTGLLHYDDLYFDQLIQPTNNTIATFVYPYLFVRGQINKEEAIVNKYKFNTKKKQFIMIESQIINKTLEIDSKQLNYSELKRLNTSKNPGKDLYNLTPQLKHKNIYPLLHNDKLYLFIKTAKKDWVFEINTEHMNIKISTSGEYLNVNIGGLKSRMFSPPLASILNPCLSRNGMFTLMVSPPNHNLSQNRQNTKIKNKS